MPLSLSLIPSSPSKWSGVNHVVDFFIFLNFIFLSIVAEVMVGRRLLTLSLTFFIFYTFSSYLFSTVD